MKLIHTEPPQHLARKIVTMRRLLGGLPRDEQLLIVTRGLAAARRRTASVSERSIINAALHFHRSPKTRALLAAFLAAEDCALSYAELLACLGIDEAQLSPRLRSSTRGSISKMISRARDYLQRRTGVSGWFALSWQNGVVTWHVHQSHEARQLLRELLAGPRPDELLAAGGVAL